MKKARVDVHYWTRQHGVLLTRDNQQGLYCVFDRLNTVKIHAFARHKRLQESEVEITLKGHGIHWKGTVADLAQCLRRKVEPTSLFPTLHIEKETC